MLLSTRVTAQNIKITEGQPAKFSGILVNEENFRDFMFQKKLNDDLESRLMELQQLDPERELCDTNVIDDMLNDGLWFLVGGAVGVLAITLAR